VDSVQNQAAVIESKLDTCNATFAANRDSFGSDISAEGCP
jgi:hypothetical protein